VNKPNPHPPQPAAILFARFLAELLDQRFSIPGTSIRIGLDPIVSLIPGIGDALANIAGSAILLIGVRLRLPRIVLLRMAMNIAANTLLGLIPVVGDIISIWFRSNVTNVQLLERYAESETQPSTIKDWFVVIAVIGALLLLLIGSVAGIIFLIKRLAAAV
jgi:uncharacterized protein DUF4112